MIDGECACGTHLYYPVNVLMALIYITLCLALYSPAFWSNLNNQTEIILIGKCAKCTELCDESAYGTPLYYLMNVLDAPIYFLVDLLEAPNYFLMNVQWAPTVDLGNL